MRKDQWRWRSDEKKRWWNYLHILTVTHLSEWPQKPPNASSFCTNILPAGWRSGCSERLCVTFMTRLSCSFVCLFLSAHFSPHRQRSLAREEVFSGPGLLALLIDLFQVPACHGIVYKEKHMCVCEWSCTRTHTDTITEALSAFPITLASWFVY